MREPSGVPQGGADPSAGGVDRVRHPSPTAHLLRAPQAGRVGPAESLRADGCCFGDDQSRGSALGIVVRLKLSRHMVDRTRPHPRQRCHDNPVRQIEIAHSKWSKKPVSRHVGVLETDHTVTTIFPTCLPASMKRWASTMSSNANVRVITGESDPSATPSVTNCLSAARWTSSAEYAVKFRPRMVRLRASI